MTGPIHSGMADYGNLDTVVAKEEFFSTCKGWNDVNSIEIQKMRKWLGLRKEPSPLTVRLNIFYYHLTLEHVNAINIK